MRQLVGLLSVALLITACSTSTPAPTINGAAEPPLGAGAVAKSPNDDNDYRALTLDNGLRVLIASDPDTDKAAAALTVFRGSNHDPEERPGLAHFLEHMLFIGTEKYPEVDGYQRFLTKHGGSSNAYTAGDHTNYFFDVAPTQLDEALDRFAQFFIAPLLDPDYVERERNAVHSEYQLHLKDDGWRGQAISRAVSNPDHPMARFNIGSLETLHPDGLHDDVVAFFNAHHSADQMALVVYGAGSLDELEASVRERFSAIENRNLGPAAEPPPILTDAQVPTFVRYQSKRQVNELAFTFALPSLDQLIEVRPGAYIAELLGHEGEGSLYHGLKTQGWIASLGAGSRRIDTGNHVLSVSMELTPSGLEHVDDIAAALFDTIDLIRRSGVSKARYAEQARIAELNFRFREPGTATRFVYLTAPRLMQFEATEVLRTPALMQRYDSRAIRDVLRQLTPDNVQVELSGPGIEGPLTEPWFNVSYSVEPFALTDDSMDIAVTLPEPNRYLPDDLTLLPDDDAEPALMLDRDGLTLWTDRDTSFGTPRANSYLGIAVSNGLVSVEDQVAATLYASYVDDVLTPRLYPATIAGLRYGIRPIDRGFLLSVHGYSDQQLTLLDELLAALPTLPIDAERFERIRDRQVRVWRDAVTARPYEQAISELGNLIVANRFDQEVLADSAQAMTRQRLFEWRDAAFKSTAVLGFTQGNVDEAFATTLSNAVTKRLQLSEKAPFRPTLALPTDVMHIEKAVDHADAAMLLYSAFGSDDLRDQAIARLTVQLLRQPYFTELRTEAQLGYIVIMTQATLKTWPGVAFIVQSPVARPDELEQATLDFLARQRAAVDRLDDTTFRSVQEALADEITKADTSGFARSARHWSNLTYQRPSDYREQLAETIMSLTQADFDAAFDELLERIETRRLVISSPGKPS